MVTFSFPLEFIHHLLDTRNSKQFMTLESYNFRQPFATSTMENSRLNYLVQVLKIFGFLKQFFLFRHSVEKYTSHHFGKPNSFQVRIIYVYFPAYMHSQKYFQTSQTF